MQNKSLRGSALYILAAVLVAAGMMAARPAEAADAQSIAFLGVHLQNDNAGFEPTSAAERARMANVERLFQADLEATQKFHFVDIPADVQKEISTGQAIGACGGCEVDYGKQLNAKLVAWIQVQKVSNLILNMTVFVADVSTAQFVFKRSVDMRGNTDESWTRSLTFLMKRYFLPAFA